MDRHSLLKRCSHDKDTGCMEYKMYKTKFGYGRISHNGALWETHRLMWTLVNGYIPPGMCVLHKCDNPPCCNIDHLFIGAQSDNMKDMASKKRSALGEKNGRSRLTADDVDDILKRFYVLNELQGDIAKEYGIRQGAVSKIVRGQRWHEIYMNFSAVNKLETTEDGKWCRPRQ